MQEYKKIPEILAETDCMYIQTRNHIYVDPEVNSLPPDHSRGKEAISSSCVGAEVRNPVRTRHKAEPLLPKQDIQHQFSLRRRQDCYINTAIQTEPDRAVTEGCCWHQHTHVLPRGVVMSGNGMCMCMCVFIEGLKGWQDRTELAGVEGGGVGGVEDV